MKPDWSELEPFRLEDTATGYGTTAGNHYGFFIFNYGAKQVRAMAADGEETGWEHVSVSVLIRDGRKAKSRMPTWDEMCDIKRRFWADDEAVIQFHPPVSEYVNNHANCLHLWKCVGQQFPLPPSILVGIKGLGTITV